MLEHISSAELSDWMAYERVAGPVGSVYQDAVLRHIANMLRGKDSDPEFPTPVEFANYVPREDYGGDD